MSGSGKEQYAALFSGKKSKDTKLEKALDIAHDIRQFEIDLYWKRAAYFWGILAIAFAGYFTSIGNKSYIGAAFVSYIGMFINLAWYLVNRGGARWQQNWEFHVDLLEDDISGPIYKTQFSNEIHRFWDVAGAYPFSPTRVNVIVSVFTFLIWIPLQYIAFARSMTDNSVTKEEAIAVCFGLFLTLISSIVILRVGRARRRANERVLKFGTREYD
jgi:uncharacterized protein with PQ loop repeat